MPGIGYADPNQSHFTSRHFWEVGGARRAPRHGLDGSVSRPLRRTGQPAAGAGARLGPAAVACDEEGARRLDRRARPLRLLDARRVGRRPGSAARRDRAARQDPDPAPTRGSSRPPTRRARPRSSTASSPRSARRTASRRASAAPSPTRAATTRSRAGWPESRRCWPPACRSAALRSRAPGAYDTHDSQPGDLADGLKLTADSLLAFQRDLEARGLADRVLVHVWSEFGRRAEENASNGTDHGAAGAGLPDRDEGLGHDGRRVPGSRQARPRRQPPRHRPTSAGSTPR